MCGLIIVFCVFFLPYIVNPMIACVDAAVSIIRFIIAFQLIANPRKTHISHLIDTHNHSYSIATVYHSLPVILLTSGVHCHG